MKKVVALIDGEHYPPVIADALSQLKNLNNWQFVCGLLLGGTEKIKSEEDLKEIGIPVIPVKNFTSEITAQLNHYKPDLVVDLSDEPVIGYKERFKIACTILKAGVAYQGADFLFTPPQFFSEITTKPSITIMGTGKRIGKTAISSAVSKTLLKMGFNPVVVAMGRGGPEEPELLHGEKEELSAERLLEFSRAGRHAASDHFENAMMSRVTTIGCRRCGGGMAGQTYISNVREGARLANTLKNDIVVFDGSGAAIPPIKTDIKILVLSASQPMEYFNDYFGPYRIALADIAIITMAEEPLASAEKIKQIESILHDINPGIEIITTYFRPEPVGNSADLRQEKVIYATTAPQFMQKILAQFFNDKFGIRVVGISSWLSNRPKLREDLKRMLGENSAGTILVELKAAAIDVVAQFANEHDLKTCFVNNIPYPLQGRDFYTQLAAVLEKRLNRGN